MLRSSRRSAAFIGAACLILASFVFASIESQRVHTDDGCEIELHCFACHWGFATTGDAAVSLACGPVLEPAGAILPFLTLLPVEAPPPCTASRGPPNT